MLFNSISYGVFLPVVFFLYWFFAKKSLRLQNILLLSVSYFFYSSWDWKFLFLLIFSTGLDYFTGIQIFKAENQKSKRFWLWLSIGINMGFLAAFKYFNFFVSSFTDLMKTIGLQLNPFFLNVILPVGISFYTFHGLSYVIDIYKGRIKPERNFVNYSVFVCFFPLLVAGPIERATHLLPQIQRRREFDYEQAVDGLKQILWGLFKKVVIADQCAEYANMVFNHSEKYNGITLLIGAVFFAFQIYGDFSGYSDMALGSAKLLGINLLKNFNYPYFSRDIAEFWRRWHISLSSWFRDYLYIPLGGSKGNTWLKVRNTIIIFVVSGFWHGANWTFLAWGVLNALFIMPSVFLNRNRINIDIVAKGKLLPSTIEMLQMSKTFFLVVIAWIFFRSENIHQAFSIVSTICSPSLFSSPQIQSKGLVLILLLFVLLEWLGRQNDFAIQEVNFPRFRVLRWSFYILICCLITITQGKQQAFIYFQF